MGRVEQLHYLGFSQFFLEFTVLVLHALAIMPSVGEAHVGIVLVALEVAAELIMRGKFRRVLGKLVYSLIGHFFVCVVLLARGFLHLAG